MEALHPSHYGQRLLCTACPALLTAPALLDCQQCTACTCYANATSSHCRVVQPRCKALQLLREHSTAEWTAQHHNRSPKGLLQLAAADVQQAVICQGNKRADANSLSKASKALLTTRHGRTSAAAQRVGATDPPKLLCCKGQGKAKRGAVEPTGRLIRAPGPACALLKILQ